MGVIGGSNIASKVRKNGYHSVSIQRHLSHPHARSVKRHVGLLASGIEPSAHRKAQNIARASAETFAVIAREWFEGQAKVWAPSHSDKVIGRLEREIRGLGIMGDCFSSKIF